MQQPLMTTRHDVVLVGGGLANGLIASRLVAARPDLSVLLLEAGPQLGGEHTWSFHASDVSAAQLDWLAPFITRSWPAQEVWFDEQPRRLGTGYHSIRSSTFHAALAAQLGARVRLGAPAAQVDATSVTLGGGERIDAKVVLDGRGFLAAPAWPCGFQKFVGLDLRFDEPHGVTVPLLMDGRVAQEDGFRFVYLLPWDERRLLVEDTVYADEPSLDLPRFRARIAAYVQRLGLSAHHVEREEAAALPIPLGGAAPEFDRPTTGVAAGLFHATTGYSLPMAVALADTLANAALDDAGAVTRLLRAHAAAHWRGQAFFRVLNRMLFKACAPAERVEIFRAFYRHHDDALIGRFYRGSVTPRDVLQVLARGAPTVPGLRALRAALG